MVAKRRDLGKWLDQMHENFAADIGEKGYSMLAVGGLDGGRRRHGIVDLDDQRGARTDWQQRDPRNLTCGARGRSGRPLSSS